MQVFNGGFKLPEIAALALRPAGFRLAAAHGYACDFDLVIHTKAHIHRITRCDLPDAPLPHKHTIAGERNLACEQRRVLVVAETRFEIGFCVQTRRGFNAKRRLNVTRANAESACAAVWCDGHTARHDELSRKARGFELRLLLHNGGGCGLRRSQCAETAARLRQGVIVHRFHGFADCGGRCSGAQGRAILHNDRRLIEAHPHRRQIGHLRAPARLGSGDRQCHVVPVLARALGNHCAAHQNKLRLDRCCSCGQHGIIGRSPRYA